MRFVGECIAACLAPTRAEAEDLANAVSVDYEVLPAVIDAAAALDEAPSLVHESWSNNLFIEREFRGGNIEEVARTAEVVVRRSYRMNRQVAVPLEGRAVLAYRDHRLDELVVYTSTQVPHIIRLGLAEVLDLEERCIRVIAPDVGGGFGSKARLSPEEAAIAALALAARPSRALGRGPRRAFPRLHPYPRSRLSRHRLCRQDAGACSGSTSS